jgi:hypothetical protein
MACCDNNTMFNDAIVAWFQNPTTATATYGHIVDWYLLTYLL